MTIEDVAGRLEKYEKIGYEKGLCPVAEDIYKITSIPLYPKLTDEDVDSVIEVVLKLVNWYKKRGRHNVRQQVYS